MARYDSSAGAALREAGAAPVSAAEEEAPAAEEREDTFFLPHDYPGKEDLQPGDMLSLRVVGKDAEGNCEVEIVPPEESEPGEAPAAEGQSPMMEELNNL